MQRDGQRRRARDRVSDGMEVDSPCKQLRELLLVGMQDMLTDYHTFSFLPFFPSSYEWLRSILRLLDPLSVFHCRQVQSHL